MPNHQESKTKSNRGFASMDKKEQREVASKGAKSKPSPSSSKTGKTSR